LERDQNLPQTLTRIVALESKFVEPLEGAEADKPAA
jgi:hypothetical protein